MFAIYDRRSGKIFGSAETLEALPADAAEWTEDSEAEIAEAISHYSRGGTAHSRQGLVAVAMTTAAAESVYGPYHLARDGRTLAARSELCACGCGKAATTTVRLLREQDRGTAEALRWNKESIDPMLRTVPVVEGHEADGIDGYVSREN